MSTWLVPLESLARRRGGDEPRAVGGKAAKLAWLSRHRFDVPTAWILPEDAFAQALRELPPGCDPRSLLRAAGGQAGMKRAAEARQEILAAALPAGLLEELEQLAKLTASRFPWGLAVRSSATCEDGALVSMAGLAESKLGVRGQVALADAIRAVWASVASGRALA
jgi:phosphoenolpyruvate synthase/pyruvate phosphate dikinase